MSAHTPGPWTQDGFNMSSVIRCVVERGSPDAKHTCGDYETIAECRGENWRANARLIAAAPELLDALQSIARIDISEVGAWEKVAGRMQATALDAIEKATGGQS